MLENPIYRATVTHLGGALEYAATAQVHLLHAEHDYDLVILDTPPTANAIDFLDAPEQIVEVASNPAARFLAGSGRVGMRFLGLASGVMLRAFEAIGGGRLVGDLGRFLADFGEILAEFQRRAGHVADLLVSPKTGVVLATAATDFSVREALAFLEVLRDRGLRVDGVVLNRVDPPLPPAPPPELLRPALRAQLGVAPADAILPDLVAIYADVRRQSERAREVQRELERRVPDVPVCTLPRIDPPPTTLAELLEMGAALWG
jgi:anion-transporting  ArsA/GET3 family ATPase